MTCATWKRVGRVRLELCFAKRSYGVETRERFRSKIAKTAFFNRLTGKNWKNNSFKRSPAGFTGTLRTYRTWRACRLLERTGHRKIPLRCRILFSNAPSSNRADLESTDHVRSTVLTARFPTPIPITRQRQYLTTVIDWLLCIDFIWILLYVVIVFIACNNHKAIRWINNKLLDCDVKCVPRTL